ncbi:putative chromatin remodeling & transcription regulator BTB-POZ family [Helianthus annuus]|nr:putative chromatin remodeling & transcription regulator BTB-POZ family [Helianthus annuus]
MEPQSHQYPNTNPNPNHLRSYGNDRTTTTTTAEMDRQPSHHHSDTGRTASELPALDCNLTSLCDHIQSEGFNHGSFSDVIVKAMGATYHLHRLILSRSSYFRNMLHGPWKDANAPVLTLHVDDNNVNKEAIAIALAYLYGYHPKLDDSNAFRVLAAASFLDLQDLCAICTDFIISELWTTNFLEYQVFAEGQDYGIHGERVRNACWGYLCQSGAMELKEVLPKLSVQTLHALLTSDELWVPSEEKRFELALYVLLTKGEFSKTQSSVQADFSRANAKSLTSDSNNQITSDLARVSLKDEEGRDTAQNILVELADQVVDSQTQVQESVCNQSNSQSTAEQTTPSRCASENNYSSSYQDLPTGGDMAAMEGPSEEGTCYQLNNHSWLGSGQRSGNGMDCSDDMSNEWGRCGMPMSWGGRIVGRREIKTCAKWICGLNGDEYDTFVSIFEGGSLLYCNMTFEALLTVRRQLEELGFPCKSVNDGLWLQTLLSQRVHEIGADTCKSCCLVSMACQCRPQYGFARTGYYMQDQEPNSATTGIGDIYFTDSSQGEVNGLFRPVRVHVRGPIDGLAGIGRGSTYVPAAAWPPTRFVFSRVPFHMGNRNGQQSLGNDDSENRGDHNGEHGGNGLTALVGLSQGSSNTDEGDVSGRLAGCSVAGPSSSGVPVQMMDSSENGLGVEWDNESSSISLDIKTPLSHFPPFRFAVEFQEVHRLNDGQVKHSPEYFYGGSMWKVSVQAFSDEDPQGRRTLGFFLHRRKAEIPESLRKAHMYVDSREKVTARYQLICPSKREVMVFGSFKQPGTLLPKAPKGWGWRTALLFDELGELLQNGALRIAAVVQLI